MGSLMQIELCNAIVERIERHERRYAACHVFDHYRDYCYHNSGLDSEAVMAEKLQDADESVSHDVQVEVVKDIDSSVSHDVGVKIEKGADDSLSHDVRVKGGNP